MPLNKQQPLNEKIKLLAIRDVLHNKQQKPTPPLSDTTSKSVKGPKQKYSNIFKGLNPLIDLNDY